jgi:sugar/nucleoside kinase (ribokinase family)
VTPDGERTMNTFLGISVELGVDQLDTQMIKDARITYLEGYLFDPPEAKAAFHEAARIAAEAGRKVALSLSDGFCVDRHRAAFRSLISGGVDILFANESELLSLYETSHFDDACRAARKECALVAVTRGARGSVIITPEERVVVPAEPISEVVDTTGAGDLYAAGFLYGYANGHDLAVCGQLAALAAAEVISHMGARPEHKLRDLAERRGLLKQ